jgi:hypothetical protein
VLGKRAARAVAAPDEQRRMMEREAPLEPWTGLARKPRVKLHRSNNSGEEASRRRRTSLKGGS